MKQESINAIHALCSVIATNQNSTEEKAREAVKAANAKIIELIGKL
ncbi:MAG: hypothetical protein V4560_14710 [Bacteroidota bacterium]